MRLPLTELELRRTASRRFTYVVRMLPIVAVLPYLFWLWAYTSGVLRVWRPGNPAEYVPWMIALAAHNVQYLAVFVLAPILCAASVADEKREGSLGLLLLADFRGTDILFAKFLTAFFQVELLLVSALPVLAIASFLGGISTPNVAFEMGLLSVCAFTICALGVRASTRASNAFEAFVYTAIAEAVWIGGTRFIDVSTGNGRTGRFCIAVMSAEGSGGFIASGAWLPGVLIALLIAAVALFEARRLLVRQAVPKPAAPRHDRRRRRRRLLRMTPVARLVAAGSSGLPIHELSTRAKVLVAAALVPIYYVPCAGQILVTALICYDVTSSIAWSRRGGALDSLLITPATNRHLTWSIIKVFLQRGVIFLPALAARNLFLARYAIQSNWVLLLATLAAYPVLKLAAAVALGCSATTLRTSPAAQAFIAVAAGLAARVAADYVLLLLSVAWPPSILRNTLMQADLQGLLANAAVLCAAYLVFARFGVRRWRAGAA
ncbi:MAG: hypothetical protein JXR94_13330 [Candidatus Hydrogenedentes bacterium]|nr:hypothetical protein [Candidatus Hydrogenedentota bacterium]